MAQPPRKRSLEDIFGAPTSAAAPPSRPSLEQIFGKPAEEEPGMLAKTGAAIRGVLDAPSRVATQTLARLAGIGESEETKRRYQSYVTQAESAFGPSGKARGTYETARDVAALPVEIAKYAGVSMIPGVGVPLAAALGAGESAGGLKEESSAALAQSLLQKAGAPRAASALTPVIESGFGRAAFDVGLGEALALGIRGGARAYRGLRDMTGQAFEQGMREGAGEAVEAATPSLARRDGFTPRTTPETDPSRLLPAQATPTIPSFAQPLPPRQPQMPGPAIPMPPGVARPEGPASPLVGLLTAQSEALRQRQFQMPPAFGPFPLPEGAQAVRGPASNITPLLPAQAESIRQRLFQMPPVGGTAGPFPAAPPAMEAPVRPPVGRRPATAMGGRPEDIQAFLTGQAAAAIPPATAEEVAKGVRKVTPKMIDRVLALAAQQSQQAQRRARAVSRVRGMATGAEEAAAEATTQEALAPLLREAEVPMAQAPTIQPERATSVAFTPQTQVPAQYKVVDARSLVTSHNPSTFQPNPNYPQGVQGRDYFTDVAARRNVEANAIDLRPEPLLDQTITPQSGAPVITPDGVVVAGNQRSMMIRRAMEMSPQRYQEYANRLRSSAAKFGLTDQDFAGVEFPVLVREIPGQPPAKLAELNRLSDVTPTKAKSAVDDAASRVSALRESKSSLEHFANTIQEDESLVDYLANANGRKFVRGLVQDGVIPQQEMGRYFTNVDMGILNEDGKNLVRRIMLMSALDDPGIVSRAPASVLGKLEGAIPHIVRADEGEAGFKIGSTVRNAIEALTEARENGLKLDDFLSQTSMLRPPFEPDVQRMARFLDTAKKGEITSAFRTYGKAATEEQVRAASGIEDMFGSAKQTPDEIRARLFGEQRPRTGSIDPRLMGQIATTGLGALGGAAVGAQQDELGGTPLQRALTGAVAGGALAAGAGYGATRMLRGRAPTGPRGSTPALQFINEGINVGQRPEQSVNRLLSAFDRFRTQIISETLPLEKAAEAGGGAGARKAVSEQIAAQQGAGQSAKLYIQERLGPAINALSEAELDDVRGLIKARRLLDIANKGGAPKAAGTPAQWAQAIRDAEANPRVKAAADVVRQMHQDLLKMRKDAGLLTDEAYEAILKSEDFYTPFVRETAEDLTGEVGRTLPGAKAGRFNVFTSGVRKMDRDVESLANTADPLEMTIASAARTFRDTRKQEVVNTLMELADNGALPFVRQVQADPTRPLAPNQFQQIRNGKVRIYAVDDADLFKAIAGQDNRSRGLALQFAQALKGIKTAGVVLNPAFAAFNVIRDVASSGIQRPDVMRGLAEAGTGGLVGGAVGAATGEERDATGLMKNFLRGAGMGLGAGLYARPLVETLQAAGKIINNDQLYRDFLREGGSTDGFYVRNPDDAQQVLKALRNTGVDLKTVVNPKSWVDALRFIGSVGEQSTRLAAYKQMIDAGKTPLEAIVNAQDRTLRFANVGAGTKTLASMTPFWNAKVQGWDKLGRLLLSKETRGKTAALGATMLTAPTLGLWFVNKDNPAYWERPQWERNLFWLVPIPGSDDFFRVPKPFELGYTFASIPERFLDYAAQRGLIESAAQQDADPGRALGRSLADMASSTFEGTLPVPQVLSTPLQFKQGRDWFRNRDIVTRPDLPEEMQGSRETSALARSLARAGVAPEKTDFVIRDLFGTAGEEGLRLSSSIARRLGADVPESDQPAPVTGLFARRFITQERGQTESEVAARDRLREVGKIVAGLRELEKGGNEAAITQYMDKNFAALDLYERIKPLQDMLDDEVAMRREVERDATLTSAERRALLADIRQRSSEISRAILETKDETP